MRSILMVLQNPAPNFCFFKTGKIKSVRETNRGGWEDRQTERQKDRQKERETEKRKYGTDTQVE